MTSPFVWGGGGIKSLYQICIHTPVAQMINVDDFVELIDF